MLRWSVTKAEVPKQVYYASVVVRNKLYSFGSPLEHSCSRFQIDVSVFNTASLRWEKLHFVFENDYYFYCRDHYYYPAGFGFTAVLIEDIIYIWGGNCNSKHTGCNLYTFDVETHGWLKPRVSGTVPGRGHSHSAFVLGKVMFIYGGIIHGGPDTEVMKLDTATMVWSLINTSGIPPAKSDHDAATIIGTRIFVFGGGNGNGNGIRVFDTETDCWLSMPSGHILPEGRSYPLAFAYNGELYIFGGQTYKYNFNDLWKFNPETFSWTELVPKGKGPCRQGMCCCMVGGRVILFGGYENHPTRTVHDLYVLDLSPSLKTLCKLAVIRYRLEQSELPRNIGWELAAMTTNNTNKRKRTC